MQQSVFDHVLETLFLLFESDIVWLYELDKIVYREKHRSKLHDLVRLEYHSTVQNLMVRLNPMKRHQKQCAKMHVPHLRTF